MPKGHHLRKNKNAAPVMRGYPKTDFFTTVEEVRAYLDGDKVTCLICGKEYVTLGAHIMSAHEITSDDYRGRFGIPYKYGLASKPFRDQGTRRMKRMRMKGIVPYQPSPETIRKMHKARLNRRPFTAATRKACGEQILGYLGMEKKWQKADYDEFFRRVKSGRTPADVGQDKDMPSRNTFMRYLKSGHALRMECDSLWEEQPFIVQSRANKVGERYRRTLVKLRCSGLTWGEVAKKMEVPESTLSSLWHLMKRRKELKKYVSK